MANILILGGGFAGLMAAEHVSKSLGGEHRVTLVSAHATFTFYPALVRLAFGDCRLEEITFDLLQKLNEFDVRFVHGEAIELKPEQRRLRVTGEDFNGEISYDFLLIASGRRLATEKIRGFFEHSHHLLGSKAALRFGEAVESLEKGRIVVGLAPQAYLPVPVCETAFALAKKFNDSIKRNEVSVSIVFPETIEQAFGGANLHRKLRRALEKHGIEVITEFPVREITEKTIEDGQGKSIGYNLLMLLPPFRGQALFGKYDFTDEFDFIKVDNLMRVSDLERVYAAGDITAFPGPKLAYSAARQGQVAAENIVSEIEGKPPRKIYRHEIAAIIDEGGADTIFLHYGIWDETLYHLKEGRMWSRMKNKNNPLWEAAREGLNKF